MKKPLLLLLLLPFLLESCSPKISTSLSSQHPPLDYRENVVVLGLQDPVPEKAEMIGTIRVGDSGFTTNCSWEVVIERARTEARRVGGNTLKITEHKQPDLLSTCHRITASVLRTEPGRETPNETVVAAPVATGAAPQQRPYYSPARQDDLNYLIPLPKWRLAVNGGWSARIAPISDNVDPEFREHIRKLKKGFHFGAEATHFVSEQVGLGLKFSTFRAANTLDVYTMSGGGATQRGELKDQITINFIGPTLSTVMWDANRKNALYSGFGIGYMSYLNNTKAPGISYVSRAGTAGLSWDLGYDMTLNPNNVLGVQLSFMAGTLSQFDQTINGSTTTIKLDKNNLESLARIDLSVGFRFIK